MLELAVAKLCRILSLQEQDWTSLVYAPLQVTFLGEVVFMLFVCAVECLISCLHTPFWEDLHNLLALTSVNPTVDRKMTPVPQTHSYKYMYPWTLVLYYVMTRAAVANMQHVDHVQRAWRPLRSSKLLYFSMIMLKGRNFGLIRPLRAFAEWDMVQLDIIITIF